MKFSKLERAVIGVVPSKPITGINILRQQFAGASVVDRDYTGRGVYTKIAGV
jgi:hypothetical protein